MSKNSDSIERSVLIQAPRERVWRALSDAQEFGSWFGARFESPRLEPGLKTRGNITFPGYEHVVFDIWIERMQAPETFVYRWHPYAVDMAQDYSGEEPTTVTFTLKDAPGGATLLTVLESGFDKLPAARREEAFRMNSGGWQAQMQNIDRHARA